MGRAIAAARRRARGDVSQSVRRGGGRAAGRDRRAGPLEADRRGACRGAGDRAGGDVRAGRHAVRDARALPAPRAHAAVHRCDPRGGDRARGRGDRRPGGARRRQGDREAAARRGEGRRRCARRRVPGAARALHPPRSHRATVRDPQGGDDPRWSDREPDRGQQMDHLRSGAATRAQAAGGAPRDRGRGSDGARRRSALDRAHGQGRRPAAGRVRSLAAARGQGRPRDPARRADPRAAHRPGVGGPSASPRCGWGGAARSRGRRGGQDRDRSRPRRARPP